MKAIRVHRFGDPDVMQVEEVPDPQPGTGQVLIEVKAVGVNPVETYIRSGRYAAQPTLPYTPGSDLAGIVEAVGPGVSRFKPGDRVYTWGTVTGAYAAKALCTEDQVHPLPNKLTFSEGAGVGIPCGTAWRALYIRGAAQPGETVLVHGASGAVGLATVQLARAAGLTVIGTAGTEQGADLVKKQGAHYVTAHDDYARILELTGGRGPDLIVEMLANVNLQEDLKVAAPGCRIVVVGSRGSIEIDPRLTMQKEVSILGLILYYSTPQQTASMHAALYAAMEAGILRPIVRMELPLADAPKAHELVMSPGAFGKIVLVP